MGRSLSVPAPGNWPEFTARVTLLKLDRRFTVSVGNGKMYHTESKLGANGNLEYSEKHEIAFTVGSGDLGRSYLIAKGDALFLSPISYYTTIRGWDLSPGYESGQFRSFTRPASNGCLFCHSGLPRPIGGTRNRYENPPFRFLAVACERCHGPGEIHVRQRRENAPLSGPVDFSIVNPARLPPAIRDDVCNQCHFSGDAKVLRPGKTELDFRPGMPLGAVLSIFTAVVPPKLNVLKALSHAEQLEMSRCRTRNNDRLNCITCHDPHVELHGAAATAYFRQKCLTCHTTADCRQSAATRQKTSPPDNCLSCHMPQRAIVNIGHSALTDHRILKEVTQNPTGPSVTAESSNDLILHTKFPQQPDAKPDLRALALAYFQICQVFPHFRKKGFEVLQQAAGEFPDDPEIQSAYGLVLVFAQANAAQAAHALQRAIDLGSSSVEVKTALARLKFHDGNISAAMQLYKQAIQADAYYTPAYLELADLYSTSGDRKSAVETLNRVLQYDPGNEEARRGLAVSAGSGERTSARYVGVNPAGAGQRRHEPIAGRF